jgi:hypothetical protein
VSDPRHWQPCLSCHACLLVQCSCPAASGQTDAQEQVVRDGGGVHEDALWDANEMALDGASKESMVERLKQARRQPYRPKGRWECSQAIR